MMGYSTPEDGCSDTVSGRKGLKSQGSGNGFNVETETVWGSEMGVPGRERKSGRPTITPARRSLQRLGQGLT